MSQTSSRLTLPEGYGVAQFDDKRWYPIKIERWYDAERPEGSLFVDTFLSDLNYSHREEATRQCWEHAHREERRQRRDWENRAQQSNVYPERCAHYLEIIEELTGQEPRIVCWRWDTEVTVAVHPRCCFRCDSFHSLVLVSALTIEDALEEAAQQVYASYVKCMQNHKKDR
jgi:hypothetical protein